MRPGRTRTACERRSTATEPKNKRRRTASTGRGTWPRPFHAASNRHRPRRRTGTATPSCIATAARCPRRCGRSPIGSCPRAETRNCPRLWQLPEPGASRIRTPTVRTCASHLPTTITFCQHMSWTEDRPWIMSARRVGQSSHLDEIRVQGAMSLEIVLGPEIEFLDLHERNRDRFEGSVLTAEQRDDRSVCLGIHHDGVIEILELAPHHVSRTRPALPAERLESVLFSFGVLDDVTENTLLADFRREETPPVVESEQGQVGVQEGARPPQRSAVFRQRREHDCRAVPCHDQGHHQVGQALPPPGIGHRRATLRCPPRQALTRAPQPAFTKSSNKLSGSNAGRIWTANRAECSTIAHEISAVQEVRMS